MSFRPSFTNVSISDDTVTVRGESDLPTDNIIATHVGLMRGAVSEASSAIAAQPVALEPVSRIGQTWVATFPVKDPGENPGPDFKAGTPVLAVGAETRTDPVTTFSWAQTLPIEAGP